MAMLTEVDGTVAKTMPTSDLSENLCAGDVSTATLAAVSAVTARTEQIGDPAEDTAMPGEVGKSWDLDFNFEDAPDNKNMDSTTRLECIGVDPAMSMPSSGPEALSEFATKAAGS